MDASELAKWWDEARDAGAWYAPWREALEGLTAEEAAWRPAVGRHSIWDIVNHMTHWRAYFVYRNTGGAPLSEEEVARRNWQPPAEVSEAAWQAARARLAACHAQVRALLADAGRPAPPKPQLDLRYLLFHDSYHFGQIMYIRALLGKAALEA
jgi:uncharacterized damage-inducible protein DinB